MTFYDSNILQEFHLDKMELNDFSDSEEKNEKVDDKRLTKVLAFLFSNKTSILFQHAAFYFVHKCSHIPEVSTPPPERM